MSDINEAMESNRLSMVQAHELIEKDKASRLAECNKALENLLTKYRCAIDIDLIKNDVGAFIPQLKLRVLW